MISKNKHLETNQASKNKNIFLFSVDLEDIRNYVNNGLKYKESVPDLTTVFLDFLKNHNVKATFFVVGDVARAYPKLIEKIYNNGHEIACHTLNHTPLDKTSPIEFKKDIEKCIEIFSDCGVNKIYGFRAPTFSLTRKTDWAYPILRDLGFVYSSSVLPAKNPLYGWPDFGYKPVVLETGLVELPMSLTQTPFLNIPFAGGIYLRLLPTIIIKHFFKKAWENNLPVLSYIHPYDIDFKQERYMQPGINENKIYNYLMYVNRKGLMNKLGKIINFDARIIRYIDYVKYLA